MSANDTKKKLLTTLEAAEVLNVPSAAGMRSAARFARERGIELLADESEWLDRRTPMYDLEKLVHYRDVQRPNRQWPISTEQQRINREKRKAELEKARAAKAKEEAKKAKAAAK